MMPLIPNHTAGIDTLHLRHEHIGISHSVHSGGGGWPHDHGCFEMVLVTHGSGINHIQDTPYPIAAGDFYIMKPGDVHEYIECDDVRIINVLFREEAFSQAHWQDLKNLPGLRPFLQHRRHKLNLSSPVDREITRLCKRLEEELKSKEPDAILSAEMLLMRILIGINRYSLENTSRSIDEQEPGPIAQIISYIHDHIQHPLTVEELADLVEWTPNHCGAVFKKKTGKSIKRYITDRRVQRARDLLENEEYSITDIAYQVGFEDLSYFGKVFKAAFGLSPREYRKKHSET